MMDVDWAISPPKAEVARAWPPTAKPDMRFMNVLKRIECFLRRGQLIWFRNADDSSTLAVAYTDPVGQKYAYRHWPDSLKVYLNEDGSVHAEARKGEYVRHWIAADDTNMIYMMLQNSEVYLAPLEE
jgi:hypothetical protein